MSISRFQRSERFYKKLFFSISILLVLAVAVSFDGKKSASSYLQNPVLTAGYLLESAGHALLQGISSLWSHYIDLVHLHEKYDQLFRDFEALKDENIRLKEVQDENQRLHKLLNIAPPVSLKFVAAQVIMRDPSNWYQSLTINKGSDSGILPGMGVITPTGIVGRVLKAGPKSSVVLLITDRNSAVAALISRTRDEGILEGTARRLTRIKYLSVDLKLNVGDQVLTSGLTPAFPKGLLIGSVFKIEPAAGQEGKKEKDAVPADPFLSVEVVPSVNFSRLEEVMVITATGNEPSVQGE